MKLIMKLGSSDSSLWKIDPSNIIDDIYRAVLHSSYAIHDSSELIITRLPYMEAILLETHRFASVAPIITPHALTTDAVCKGFAIPKV